MAGRVLIVDDDFDIREALGLILRDEGYVVDAAANGQDALDHLSRSAHPSVILLDLMMPVMNGIQFRNLQRLDDRICAIPVIIISADSSVRDKAAAMGVGYLKKPLQLPHLLEELARLCG